MDLRTLAPRGRMVGIKEAARLAGMNQSTLSYAVKHRKVKNVYRTGGGKKPHTFVDMDEIERGLASGKLKKHTRRDGSPAVVRPEPPRKTRKYAPAPRNKALVIDVGLHFNRGMTAAQLAEKHGVDKSVIYILSRQLRRSGIDIPLNALTAADKDEFKEAVLILKKRQEERRTAVATDGGVMLSRIG